MRRFSRYLILGLAVLGIAASASASPMIVFMGDPTAGAITDTGTHLNAFDLNISWMYATDTPLFGTYTGHHASGNLSIGDDGTMSLVGMVYDGLIPDYVHLLSGTISGYAWQNGQGSDLTIWGSDTKDPVLLGALGFPSDQLFSDFSLLIKNVSPDENKVMALSNTAVPEPSSLLFLGSGFLGLSRIVRRRLGR
jgi:hypothetical protein